MLRRLLLLAALLVAGAGSLLLVERVTGAGPSTSLMTSSFASASGPMSSSSYHISTSLAETGWVGRAQSASNAIHIGAAWTMSASKGDVVPAIPLPSQTVWGLLFLVAALADAGAMKLRRARSGAAALRR
jgi:hypothetical protein